MTLTSFIIKTTNTKALASGKRYNWNTLAEPGNVFASIDTGEADLSTDAIDRNRLVSGVPTPFARVVLFKQALRRVAEGKTDGERVLDKFLAELVDEWKGLIGLFAIHGDHIRCERVPLAYPGEGRLKDKNLHLFDMRGSLGAMLFDAAPMWCDPTAPDTGVMRPFIDIIYYRDQVIGATSPEVLVFTGVHRGLPEQTPFVSDATKRLTDPLKWDRVKREDLVALYHFVHNMLDNWNGYREQFPEGKQSRPDTLIDNVLEKWLSKIREKLGANHDYKRSPKPTFREMAAPFAKVFEIDNKLFGANGRVALSKEGLSLASGSVFFEFAPKDLLASTQSTVLELPVTKEDEAALAVHLLRVETSQGHRYFTLPLSPVGLALFEPALSSLLGTGGDSRSRLRATIDDQAGVLSVTLELEVDGTIHPIKAEYRGVELLQGGGRVMCWPNFVHKDWREYYLYSEVPHNGRGVQAFPLRGDEEAMRLMITGGGGDAAPQVALAYRNGDPAGPGAGEWRADKPDSIELVIGVDQSKLNDSDFLYEVYKSKRPFKGLAFRRLQQDAGYIVFRDPQWDSSTHRLRRLPSKSLSEARVGVDFGSNNTCVSYFKLNSNWDRPQLVNFTNRRRFLLGRDNESGPGQQVTPGEGFFFQNEELAGNDIKSMVTIHDDRRLMQFADQSVHDQHARLGKAVIGGVPFFERNVAVEESSGKRHRVKFGSQTAEILYDLKWSQDEREMAHQRAFLRTLWLKVWAELFEADCRPAALVWAVPSAMSASLRGHYQTLWKAVVEEPPVPGRQVQVAEPPSGEVAAQPAGGLDDLDAIVAEVAVSARRTGSDVRAFTESTAVSRYAAFCRAPHNRVKIDTQNYHIGLDVGGSTTDFLCLVQRKVVGQTGYQKTLITEGSIRLAAGSLALATGLSEGFKGALERFCFSSPNFKRVAGLTQGASLLTPSTAPYYFNLILDRMGKDEFQPFYSELRKSCPELFILNAFVTGFIQFHAGQLAYRVHLIRQAPNSGFGDDIVKGVSIAPYGKGGRIFDWLPATVGGDAKVFYQKAFLVGFGVPVKGAIPDEIKAILPKPEFKDSELSDAKREVAFGLAYEGGNDDIITPSDKLRDMVGQRGYTFKGQPLNEWADIDPAQLEQIGGDLKVPATFERLGDFLTLFEAFVEKNFDGRKLNTADIIENMKLASFVQNDPEFTRAKREAKRTGKKFDFHAPLIVLEAMCFLEDLKTSLFKKNA